MPFSIIIHGYPKDPVPVAHVQGSALHGMFLHLIGDVDPAMAQRLHEDARYRPYTLSPLGIGSFAPPPLPPRNLGGERGGRTREPIGFQGFRLPRDQLLRPGAPCAVRLTLLEDALFPTVARYFLERPQPTFQLGETEFVVTEVLATPDSGNPWSTYVTYAELIERHNVTRCSPRVVPCSENTCHCEEAAAKQSHDSCEIASQRLARTLPSRKKLFDKERQITLRFLTPTSFSKGDVDLPLPLPRLVFQSYWARFQEFQAWDVGPDFLELVDEHTGIARLDQFRTDTIKTKKVTLTGFVGDVTFELSKQAPPELLEHLRLLADFAFFCGTGKKTTMGMGQTVRIKN